jgi:hypothetical protein
VSMATEQMFKSLLLNSENELDLDVLSIYADWCDENDKPNLAKYLRSPGAVQWVVRVRALDHCWRQREKDRWLGFSPLVRVVRSVTDWLR